jgi:single-strand DNA-binding protein
MSGLNKAMLIGYLGADPEMRYTQSGAAITNFSIATNETWSDREGGKKERTEWHRIVAFGKLGELCDNYLRKGRQVYVEGRLQTRQWDDRDGNKRYTTEVVARDIVFLGGRNDEQQDKRNNDLYAANPEPDTSAVVDDDYPF